MNFEKLFHDLAGQLEDRGHAAHANGIWLGRQSARVAQLASLLSEGELENVLAALVDADVLKFSNGTYRWVENQQGDVEHFSFDAREKAKKSRLS